MPFPTTGSAPSKWRNNCCHSVMEFLPFPRVSVPYFPALASSEIFLLLSLNPSPAQLNPQGFVLPPVHIKTNFFPFHLHLKAVHESSVAWCCSSCSSISNLKPQGEKFASLFILINIQKANFKMYQPFRRVKYA